MIKFCDKCGTSFQAIELNKDLIYYCPTCKKNISSNKDEIHLFKIKQQEPWPIGSIPLLEDIPIYARKKIKCPNNCGNDILIQDLNLKTLRCSFICTKCQSIFKY